MFAGKDEKNVVEGYRKKRRTKFLKEAASYRDSVCSA
jgi:hypothetical protein